MSIFGDQDAGDWQGRLNTILDMMREMSVQTDPQEMVRSYGARIRQLMPRDGSISMSRRDLTRPRYRITRSSTWEDPINPWKEKDRLPLFEGGLLAELIYADAPKVIDKLEFGSDEPAVRYLAGYRSLMAIPLFDQGVALNMVVLLAKNPGAFDRKQLPEQVWMANLFGRATSNLVLSEQLHQAYQALDREFKVVGDIQRSLLPAVLPIIATMDLAAYYQPSTRAGGDYYDFFPMPDGKWGIIIADVSGHGTPAAVLMAITHSLAHTHPGPPNPPAAMLEYLNRNLATWYAGLGGTFVTAFYGVYDPKERTITYSSAGHNPPRLKRCQDGSMHSLDGAGGLPLGILADGSYEQTTRQLQPGDQIIFYTDGIVEARNHKGELFGVQRLDVALENCSLQAKALMDTLIHSVEEFASGHAADDDRTVIVARIS
ncbi:MAG TPA: PP2C family protein-serine/threonine phosphatase [Gemmataceae bacterium]|nr:PP2C family protein-serine/threonine phosphatase [Gemmataceae bacterium]